MRRSRAPRLALAACFGSFLLGVFYFQSSLDPGGSETWTLRGSARFVLKRSAVPEWELCRGWGRAALLCAASAPFTAASSAGSLELNVCSWRYLAGWETIQ